jgi:hypothetical protein
VSAIAASAIEMVAQCLDPGVEMLWTPVVVANNDPDPTRRVAD